MDRQVDDPNNALKTARYDRRAIGVFRIMNRADHPFNPVVVRQIPDFASSRCDRCALSDIVNPPARSSSEARDPFRQLFSRSRPISRILSENAHRFARIHTNLAFDLLLFPEHVSLIVAGDAASPFLLEFSSSISVLCEK
jgi:hypothetical protein